MALAAACLLTVAACSPDGAGSAAAPSTTSGGDQGTTTTTTNLAAHGAGLARVPAGGADVYTGRDGSVSYRAAAGLVFPVLGDAGDWLEVLTTCNDEEWVRRDEIEVIAASLPGQPGPGYDLSGAVLVLDPGHGGRDLGAKGATGSNESDVNLAIADLLMDRLTTSQDVDWTDGHVKPGSHYPAVKAVWMTRGPDSPDAGDIELGLAYRAGMANAVGADALISIHNNTTPAGPMSTPGSDVFYSVSSPGSDRLASLIHQELMIGFAPFSDSWTGATETGPKARVDADTGDDFYGLLRRTTAPSVIVEGLYISEETEERILESRIGQQAYADAVYRGVVRFLTTDDWGTTPIDPVGFSGTVGTPSVSSCVVPSQP